MTLWVEQLEDERVIHGNADGLLYVTGPVRLLGHAYDRVHIHPGGTLVTSGIIRDWLRIDTGGSCYSSGWFALSPNLSMVRCSTSAVNFPFPASLTNCTARSSSPSVPATKTKCSDPTGR